MATIISRPDSLSFLTGINDLKFQTGADHVVLTVTIAHAGSTETVMQETMYPIGGYVALEEMSQLLEPYIRRYLSATVSFQISERDASDTQTASTSLGPYTVLFSMVDIGDDTVSTFTSSHFLTILNGEKMTAMGREERLYAYNASQVTITATLLVSGSYVTRTATLNAAATTGGVSAFFVGPDNVHTLLSNEGRLTAYTVTAGSREQRFVMVEDDVPPAPSLAFINSFGCLEFLHCVGTHKKDSKYDRSSARINGMKRNYKVTEDRQFTANTGWLNTPMADWADEVMRSQEVYVWVDGRPWKEVVLSDSKSVITNEDDDMPAFELTYSYSQRIHNVMQRQHAGRIFDNTFDHTFN